MSAIAGDEQGCRLFFRDIRQAGVYYEAPRCAGRPWSLEAIRKLTQPCIVVEYQRGVMDPFHYAALREKSAFRKVLGSFPLHEMTLKRYVLPDYRPDAAYVGVFEWDDTHWEVDLLYVAPRLRRQGLATRLFTAVCAAADAAGAEIRGHAIPQGTAPGVSREQLVAFYARFGAHIVEGSLFCRMPRAQRVTGAQTCPPR